MTKRVQPLCLHGFTFVSTWFHLCVYMVSPLCLHGFTFVSTWFHVEGVLGWLPLTAGQLTSLPCGA